jgi:hypothetical protein
MACEDPQPNGPRRRQVLTLLVALIVTGALAASAAASETRGTGHVDAALKALVPPVDKAAVCFVHQAGPSAPAHRGNRIRSIAFGVEVEHAMPDDKFVYGFSLRVRTTQDRGVFSGAGECGWAYRPGPPSLDPVIRCSAECDGGALTVRQDGMDETLVLDLGTFLGGKHLGCGSNGRAIAARDQPDEGFRLARAPLSRCWPGRHGFKEAKP